MVFESLASHPNYIFLLWIALFMTMTVSVVGVCITVVTSIVILKSNGENNVVTFTDLLDRANALQMASVILIVIAACALRAIDHISPEAVVSIISGVAGYVLGGSAHFIRPERMVGNKSEP